MTTGKMGALALALALGGCTTTFYGSSRVQNGPRGCWDQCQAWGMDLAGMVKMGEYSDGCICQVRPPAQQRSGARSSDAGAPLAVDGPAVAGVWLQMQAAANAAHATAAHQHQQGRQPGGVGGAHGGHFR